MATNTIRLSLSSLVVAFILLFGLGIGGGILGSRIFPAPLPLRSDTNGTVIPVSQQITVSPSKIAADIVSNHGKSIFLLAYSDTKDTTPFGTGIALTNDGILMTTQSAIADRTVVAIGENGDVFPVNPVGSDALSGISFYKVSGKIISPLNLAQQAPRVASALITLSRTGDAATIVATPGSIAATSLPIEGSAPGIQSLLTLQVPTVPYEGSALLDEQGDLVGAMVVTNNTTAVSISDIRGALARLASNNLSFNPFAALGFTLAWESVSDEQGNIRVQSKVARVENNGPADTALLQAGDVVTAIGNNRVSWDTNMVQLLSAKPLTLTVLRKGEQRTISLSE